MLNITIRHVFSQVKVLPVSAGCFSMNTKTQRIISAGAISALNEYTSSLFGYIPKSKSFFEHANTLITNRGKKEACKVLKEYYRVASLLACDQPFTVDQSGMSIACDRDGFPIRLKAFKAALSGKDVNKKRSCLTVLSSFRLIRCEPTLDLTSIMGASKWSGRLGRRLQRLFDQSAILLAERIGEDVPVDTGFHLSSKKGPNGPVLETVVDDAHAFFSDDILVGAWETLNSETKSSCVSDVEFGERLFQAIPEPPSLAPQDIRSRRRESIRQKALSLPAKRERLSNSRIAAIAAAGWKTRIVAQCDWFTQDALKPIHKWAYRCLRKIRQDGTFSHNRIAQRAKMLNGVGLRSWCFDLSAATDRFPALLQRDLLERILGSPIANAWYTLVTQRSFDAKGVRGIVYSVGQPMGALSSWAVFSLCHHVIVQMAAISWGASTKGRWFAKYIMIGDDIAIFHEDVAKTYQRILEDLDVPLNLAKSLVPPPEGVGAVEIAKRTFVNGSEVSPWPPDIIVQAKGDANVFPMLVRLSQDRSIVKAHERSPVLSLLQKWYQPQVVTAVELVLYDPRDSRALLKEEVTVSESPWAGMSEADVSTEADYIYLRRIKDKSENLAARLKRATKFGARTDTDEPTTHADNPSESAFSDYQLPVEALRDRLRLVAQVCSMLHTSGNTMEFALDLAELELGLDALDTYISRRPSQIRTRTVGNVLTQVHGTLKELADLGFGGDDDDW